MATDTVTPPEGTEVMASIDDEGEVARFVIADVSVDETWLSVPADSAATLAEWR